MNISRKILKLFLKDGCFETMIKEGNLTENNRCGGICGGDKHTNYLSYACVDCKNFDEELFRKDD
jgi:hypothetical protein